MARQICVDMDMYIHPCPRFCCVLPAHGLRGDWDGVGSPDLKEQANQIGVLSEVREMFAHMASALAHSKACQVT